jgi:hypothetical protein
MDWQPIKRSGQQVKGTDPQHPGFVMLEVTLSANPPGDWIGLWKPLPPNAGRSASYGPPSVSGRMMTLVVPDGLVKDAIEMLDGQIAAANKWYEDQIIPRREAAQHRAQQDQEDERRRLEEAQRQLDELGPPS